MKAKLFVQPVNITIMSAMTKRVVFPIHLLPIVYSTQDLNVLNANQITSLRKTTILNRFNLIILMQETILLQIYHYKKMDILNKWMFLFVKKPQFLIVRNLKITTNAKPALMVTFYPIRKPVFNSHSKKSITVKFILRWPSVLNVTPDFIENQTKNVLQWPQ